MNDGSIPSIQSLIPITQESRHRKKHPKNKFSPEEDIQLRRIVEVLGTLDWDLIAANMPHRNERQCRERWCNYLSPDVQNSSWTPEEDNLLIQKQAEFGSKWVKIARSFPKRTDVNVKNRWMVICRRKARLNQQMQQQQHQKEPALLPLNGEPKTILPPLPNQPLSIMHNIEPLHLPSIPFTSKNSLGIPFQFPSGAPLKKQDMPLLLQKLSQGQCSPNISTPQRMFQ